MIYDFKMADEAMAKLGVDPIQFHLLYLLYHRAEGLSSTAELERFRDQVLDNEDQDTMRRRIDKLEALDLIENLGNTKDGDDPGLVTRSYNTDYLVVTDKFIDAVIAPNPGEELWSAYPAAFSMSDGGHFLARFGDKDEIAGMYNRKIKKDRAKHKFVMEQLEIFKHMVKNRKINGVKIQNFIMGEMWDVVNEINEMGITITDHGHDI